MKKAANNKMFSSFCQMIIERGDTDGIMQQAWRRNVLRILEIKGLHHSLSICLITAGARVYPRCVENFIDVSRESYEMFYEKHIK